MLNCKSPSTIHGPALETHRNGILLEITENVSLKMLIDDCKTNFNCVKNIIYETTHTFVTL